jgi:hypothetical protein
MVISMTIAMPLLIGLIPLDKMMDLFVVGSANLPVAIQIQFTQAISSVFMVSAVLTVPAIIVSAMRGKEDLDNKKSIPDDPPGRIGSRMCLRNRGVPAERLCSQCGIKRGSGGILWRTQSK